ncbi:MAG: hypothetical protein Q9191_006462 [Dirinaria sp. TL-2023a]
MKLARYSYLPLLVLQSALGSTSPLGQDEAYSGLLPDTVQDISRSQVTPAPAHLQAKEKVYNANPCTWNPSQITPTDIPSASPYLSTADWHYFPMGSQNGNILASTYGSLWASGPSQYPDSNSYANAVSSCSSICDTDLACLSFNVITIVEEDFNNCVPTYECRFSNKMYDPEDYFTDNGTPSYVWSLQRPNPPDCNFTRTSTSWESPAVWKNLGMDNYINHVARTTGIIGETSDYLVDLMSELGWRGYGCTDDNAACDFPPLDTCADWINHQIATFEGYMSNNKAILQTILNQVSTQGEVAFDSFWWQKTTGSPYDPTPIAEGIINAAIGLIPEIGSVAYLIATGLETLIDQLHQNPGQPVIVTPNNHQSWINYVATLSTQTNNAKNAIHDMSRSVTQSIAGLTKVVEDGRWIMKDPETVKPDASNVWSNLQPYFQTKIAMQSMKAQSVFLMYIPVVRMHPHVACTQAIADEYAHYISSSNYKNVAWCNDQDTVVLPIVGYNIQVYYPFQNVTNILQTNLVSVASSSYACYMPFDRVDTTINLYQNPPQQPINANTSDVKFDMTQPCAYNVPVCEWGQWYGVMQGQKPDSQYLPSDKYFDDLHNLAWWCAYNFGFTPQVSYCGDVTHLSGPFSPPIVQHECYNWKPAKTFNVNHPTAAKVRMQSPEDREQNQGLEAQVPRLQSQKENMHGQAPPSQALLQNTQKVFGKL